MIIGVPRESYPGETRVALIPAHIPQLTKAGLEVQVQAGAGAEAGFPDADYTEKGAKIVDDRKAVFDAADIILQVRAFGANLEQEGGDRDLMKKGQAVLAFSEPLAEAELMKDAAGTGVSLFSMELIPRITRAQSMDALSSMATIAGYKLVLQAASQLPKMFPMLMTAAGTISPAKVLVVGAGVAGLQALATANRLGAVAYGYDLRPETREQVESVGAEFVELDLDTSAAQGSGGYAGEQSEDFQKKQQAAMRAIVEDKDVVITTAAIPGRKAPVIVTEDMVKAMPPKSVIVDLAAERGGNCELTECGKVVEKHGVTIIGPANLPATVPNHASQMYSKNITTLLKHLVTDGKMELDLADEITAGTLVFHDGEVRHAMVRDRLGMEPLDPPKEEEPAEEEKPEEAESTEEKKDGEDS
jgi:NAD(P) transhydrogenase subunit alpha